MALRRVGARHLADRTYAALPGGEKQRVLIARTLAQDTDHLLLDEPTNHLDIRYQHEILQLVRTLGVTTVVVLHDLNLASRYCDELVLLDGGRVVCAGTPDAVLTAEVLEPVLRHRRRAPHPRQQRAADLRSARRGSGTRMSAVPLLLASGRSERRRSSGAPCLRRCRP
ncbi:MAG: ABC transporter ATP-binding protein [Pseudonocardia sp.]